MTFAFAGHELDPRRQELRRAGEVVHVEPQVFDLLAFLIRNRDRIVSKDEILDTIWDGRIVSEAALSSRINAARKAVGDNGNDQAFIRTFHKRGFRFVAEATELADGDGGGASPHGAIGTAAAESGPGLEGLAVGPAPDHGKPSVAVLPFANLSQDPEHEYFAYGLTEDVIRLLGRNRWLTVMTRHATAPYRGAAVDARAVGAALGVRYLVEGSVRKHGDRVRITAELVSAETGGQLWSEVHDLQLADIFDIQDAMAQQIAAVIEPELASVEQEIAARKAPENLDAWDCYQRGFYHLWGFTTPGFAEAEALFRRAVDLDPGFARAHAALSYVHLQKTFYGDPKDRPALLEAAMGEARTSVALDERDSLCHCVLGRAHCMQRQYDDAIAALEATVALNPSFAQGYFALAFTLVWCGREDEAIALLETAAELSPRDPHIWTFHHTRAFAHFSLGEMKSAAFFARKASRHPNATYWTFATLASALGHLGEREEARAAVAELLERKPGYAQGFAREDLFFCANPDFVDAYAEGLARAGVPA
ncbi:MAG TPA: tetratricopeptide repeat protein [Beijerinckiaceae bacterium]|jgi:TolB-like protein/DNA-binding winged helix-turn-helix (wHTH) protein